MTASSCQQASGAVAEGGWQQASGAAAGGSWQQGRGAATGGSWQQTRDAVIGGSRQGTEADGSGSNTGDDGTSSKRAKGGANSRRSGGGWTAALRSRGTGAASGCSQCSSLEERHGLCDTFTRTHDIFTYRDSTTLTIYDSHRNSMAQACLRLRRLHEKRTLSNVYQ